MPKKNISMKIVIRHSLIEQSAQQNNVEDIVYTIVNSNQSSIKEDIREISLSREMYKTSLGQERYIRDLSRLREMCEIFVFDSDV